MKRNGFGKNQILLLSEKYISLSKFFFYNINISYRAYICCKKDFAKPNMENVYEEK